MSYESKESASFAFVVSCLSAITAHADSDSWSCTETSGNPRDCGELKIKCTLTHEQTDGGNTNQTPTRIECDELTNEGLEECQDELDDGACAQREAAALCKRLCRGRTTAQLRCEYGSCKDGTIGQCQANKDQHGQAVCGGREDISSVGGVAGGLLGGAVRVNGKKAKVKLWGHYATSTGTAEATCTCKRTEITGDPPPNY